MAIVDGPTELSEQVLKAVKDGQQGALDAVRTFAEAVDRALPMHGEGPSKRQEVIDSALAMADRLVQTQYGFLSSLIRSAGNALGATQEQAAAEQPAEEPAEQAAEEPAEQSAEEPAEKNE